MRTERFNIKLNNFQSNIDLKISDMSEDQALTLANAIREILGNHASYVTDESLVLSLCAKYPDSKLAAVKELKEIKGLGLKEAKDLFEMHCNII